MPLRDDRKCFQKKNQVGTTNLITQPPKNSASRDKIFYIVFIYAFK
jgi:hypothetical protein